jgi:hypothetical protein
MYAVCVCMISGAKLYDLTEKQVKLTTVWPKLFAMCQL